ncbi:hypothetical protein FGIG_11307 [Fasciola gigantica]|uniref:Uncharacterized protein n=1 Tax=Fasciola gigantica TaxID=46835 RepID=A0A504YVI6_FASGI|nr:hypothetical protein FGIG_11307 [Fasciola gigantica]
MERSIKESERATKTAECEVELVKISEEKVAQSIEGDSGGAGRNEVAENSSDEENEFHMVYSSEFSSTDTETQPSSTSSSVKEDSARQKTDTGSSNSDELNLMSGYQQFIGGCLYRKMLLEDSLIDSSVETHSDRTSRALNLLGVEHKLMGAVTFRIRYLRKTKRIVHIIFLAIRHHWREKHLGTMLIKLVKDTQIVGPYDAIVVHADIGAESFFSRLGFTENLLLNQQWSEVAEEYINCRLMTFVPGLSSVDRTVGKWFSAEQDVNHVWLTKLDHELEACVKQTEQTNCANLLLYRRLREELITLKTSVSNQIQLICDLSKELRACYQRRLRHIRWRQKCHYDSIPVEDERLQTSDLVPSATETRIRKRIQELERLLIELTKDSTLVSVPDVISLAETHGRGDNQTACNNDNGAHVTATASEVEKRSDEYESLTESDDDSDNGDSNQSFGLSCDGAENTESVKINIVGAKDIGYRRQNRRIRKQSHKLCSSSLL